jgi:hypothetical protein
VPRVVFLAGRHIFVRQLRGATRPGGDPAVGIRQVVTASLELIEHMASAETQRSASDGADCCRALHEPDNLERFDGHHWPGAPLASRSCADQWRARFVDDPGLAIETALGTLLRRGVDGGVFRATLDTGVTARAMMGAIAGVARWFAPGRHTSAVQLTETLTALYLRGLGGL